jgi:hypothetical protein
VFAPLRGASLLPIVTGIQEYHLIPRDSAFTAPFTTPFTYPERRILLPSAQTYVYILVRLHLSFSSLLFSSVA